MNRHLAILAIVVPLLGMNLANATAQQSGGEPGIHRLETKHLPNAVQIHPKVISGGLPADDAAFEELRSLGVKTIISVDGAVPDVETAKKHGLRYVHLPYGYDGIPEQRVRELAKAVRDLPGPVYIHCHHGKHRSPVGAATACVAIGLIKPENAMTALTLAQTSPEYRGLYESARSAHRLEDRLLDELQADFPEVAEVPPLAEEMVQVEHTFDHLQAIADSRWQTPTDHPDLDPAHEALMLREHFTELLRTDEVRNKTKRFRELMQEGETASTELESMLRATNRAEAARAFDKVSASCATCHQEYRDVPLSEK